MSSNWLAVSEGSSQRRIGSNTEAVCSDENESVDIEKMTPPHSTAGPHACSHAGTRGGRTRARISGKWGAGRGLRHGWNSATRNRLLLRCSSPNSTCGYSMRLIPFALIPCALLHSIVRRFFRDDDVMHVALAQSRGGDSHKFALLPQFLPPFPSPV